MFNHKERLKRAKEFRTISMINASTLPDEQAVVVPTLYPKWEVGIVVNVDERYYYEPTDKLYKCIQAHTTQSDWTPDVTPAMWVIIAVSKPDEEIGTLDNPITAARSMEYEYGKYYLDPEDSNIYICERGSETGTIVLHFMPHELVGNYFTLVE